MSKSGRVSLVTGGASGLGEAIVNRLASDGDHVVVADVDEPRARRVVDNLVAAGLWADMVTVDVTSEGEVAAMFDGLTERHGRLDALVCSAAIETRSSVVDCADDDWQRVLDINLTGSFLCAQAAFALMLKQDPKGGRIINNGSISAHVPRPNSVAYTSCKHAITGLTKSTSLDGRKYDIACGQIDIGNALTEMTQRMQRGVPQANGTVIEEPVMDVQNVARAVVFMATVTPEANVQFLTVMATKMPFVGRG